MIDDRAESERSIETRNKIKYQIQLSPSVATEKKVTQTDCRFYVLTAHSPASDVDNENEVFSS